MTEWLSLNSDLFILIFIEMILVLKALERSDTFRPSNSLSHRQNSKQVYHKTAAVFFFFCETRKTVATEGPNAQML